VYLSSSLAVFFSPFADVTHTLSLTLSISGYRVVPADSHQIPRARCYSGTTTHTTHCLHLQGSHLLRPGIPTHFTKQYSARSVLVATEIHGQPTQLAHTLLSNNLPRSRLHIV